MRQPRPVDSLLIDGNRTPGNNLHAEAGLGDEHVEHLARILRQLGEDELIPQRPLGGLEVGFCVRRHLDAYKDGG